MKHLHFIGIGGIGMSGLASWCRARGWIVTGSDRDSGKKENAHIFAPLLQQGIRIFPQDGSYLKEGMPDALIYSSAIEESNADFTAGKKIRRIHRSLLLAELIREAAKNAAIAVAGSCGKSTVTAYMSEALANCGDDAGFLNGAISKRYANASSVGNFHPGKGRFFVFEADESDKSLINYAPDYAIILNMGTDHYSKEELAEVFGKFLNNVRKGAVLEKQVFDAVAPHLKNKDIEIKVFGTSPEEEYFLSDYRITYSPEGSPFPSAIFNGDLPITLPAPGHHTALNALAIFAMLEMTGFSRKTALEAVQRFDGIRRRNDRAGTTAAGIPVYDDYAHNPEKIASCIKTLSEITTGRIFTIFQPHGFGPLGFFRNELFETLENCLKEKDEFFMLPPFYAGGTSSFKPTSEEVIAQWKSISADPGRYSFASDREELRKLILEKARPGDLIVIMGARDNSLSLFAQSFCSASNA